MPLFKQIINKSKNTGITSTTKPGLRTTLVMLIFSMAARLLLWHHRWKLINAGEDKGKWTKLVTVMDMNSRFVPGKGRPTKHTMIICNFRDALFRCFVIK